MVTLPRKAFAEENGGHKGKYIWKSDKEIKCITTENIKRKA